MSDAKTRIKRGAIPVLLLAAPAGAAAQQAAWAEARREPICVYDGLIAPGAAAVDSARVGTIRSECMQRFGWTEAQGNRGLGGQVARRLVERGLAPAAAGKAILMRMMATHMIAEFAREVMASPGG
ncbi:MAG: hypothetical protein QOD42_3459 [Sphingomonadales bacterium]|jgi:hypothetical protein|nr:hypothetical protein [Sphingomonadales bacterium]